MAYDADKPSYHMLICLIEIWNPKGKTPQEMLIPEGKPDVIMAEVESLEIRESYRNVVGSAAIKFPRGTIIKKTIENPVDYASEVTAEINSQGAIIEKRTETEVAKTSNFCVDSRIRISLGYTDDYKVYNLTRVSSGKPSIFTSDDKLNEFKGHLKTMFEGFITKCSIDTPIEIECEDLAHLLKCVTCKKLASSSKTKAKELLVKKQSKKGSKDKVDVGILANTGLGLHPDTEDITVGKCTITSDFTAFDVLNSWHKHKIYSYLAWDNDGNPCIAVRRSYFHNADEGSLVHSDRNVTHIIDFDYHVADNNLTCIYPEQKSLAVQASSKDADGKKTTTLTVMMNPMWKEGDPKSDKWRVINETKISKKAMKKHHIHMVSEEAGEHMNLSEYTVIEYHSKNIGLTHDKLLDEAIKFFDSYNINGVEGDLVIFGDLKIRTTDIVQLNDTRFPIKNGKYLVEEVVTKFGTNGFRQSIKLPYCLERKDLKKESEQQNG